VISVARTTSPSSQAEVPRKTMERRRGHCSVPERAVVKGVWPTLGATTDYCDSRLHAVSVNVRTFCFRSGTATNVGRVRHSRRVKLTSVAVVMALIIPASLDRVPSRPHRFTRSRYPRIGPGRDQSRAPGSTAGCRT
jgi:hypothetical protein